MFLLVQFYSFFQAQQLDLLYYLNKYPEQNILLTNKPPLPTLVRARPS